MKTLAHSQTHYSHRVVPAALVAVLLAALPVAGCGGGGSASIIAPLPASTPATGASDPTKGTDFPTPVVTPAPVDTKSPVTQIAQQTENDVNQQRIANGLPALKHNNLLEVIATAYAQRMARETFFSHNDAEGKRVWDRVNAAGYTEWNVIGENLAWVKTTEGDECAYVTKGWMNSPTHRANILKPNYTEGAIGAARASDGKYYLVQIFSEPR